MRVLSYIVMDNLKSLQEALSVEVRGEELMVLTADLLEDLIEVLIDKRVILLTDLPAEAQQKILSRGRLREHLRSSQGLIDDDMDAI